ncbi:hypothetical protein MHBO_000445 [Bonamia ostreae]|uniref:Uncharacterized protein n=1 Tax=Bonamia ostreae TaxID=126728 RepID=A0ABV2AFK9_9EUKA
MVAVLFMVGKNLERPDVVDFLLDLGSCTSKPSVTKSIQSTTPRPVRRCVSTTADSATESKTNWSTPISRRSRCWW